MSSEEVLIFWGCKLADLVTSGDDLIVSEETVESITRALQADRDDDQPAKRMPKDSCIL
jgi:hypothetical protein